jgi:hypothetical protein
VTIPSEADEPVPLSDFSTQQKRQIENVRQVLGNEWNKSAGDILREELDNLDKD